MCCILFSFVSKYFLSSLWFILWPIGCLRMCCLVFTYLCFYLLLLTSSFIPLWSEKILGMISVFLNLLRLVLWLNMWTALQNNHVYLKRMCILLFLGEVLSICLVQLFCSVKSSGFFFNWSSLCSIHNWKWSIEICYCYYVAVYLSLQFCQCLLYIFGSSNVRGMYIIIVISSWWIDAVII